MTSVLDWVTVERADGHSLEVRRADEDPDEQDVRPQRYGVVRVTEHGWIAEAPSGVAYGPFATMGEAAYPLALAGQGQDARHLLGAPLPGGGLPRRAPASPATPPARPRWNRIVTLGLVAVAVAAVVAERRLKHSERGRTRPAA